MAKYLPFILLLVVAQTTQAAAYQCRDAAGKKVFQQFPCASVTSAIEPLQTDRIDSDQVRETLRRYRAAVLGNDQRARASFFSDDFTFAVYDNARFEYLRDQQRKQDSYRLDNLLSHAAQAVGTDDVLGVEILDAANHRYLVRVADAATGSQLQRMEFTLADGRLLIRRWDVAHQ